MAENPIDVPQMKSCFQENEEASLVYPFDTGLEQSDHLSCSVPQERFVLDGNEESSEKCEEGISQNQEFGESKSIYVPQERFVHQPVAGNAESLAEFEKGFKRNQEFGKSKNVSVPQERSVLQPVDGNTESLAKFDEGINRNQGFPESKNIFGNDVRLCGWKFDVIDDIAVIETVTGGVREEELVGFACYLEKSCWNQMKKQEKYGKNVHLWRKVKKGSRNGSKTSWTEKGMTPSIENQNVYKRVYQRSVFLDEQTKERKSEVHFGSIKCSRSNENRNVLTRNLDGQNMGHKNYRMKNKEEGQSSSNVEEQVKNMKTNKVCNVWRKCSRTSWNEKSFTHKFEDQNLFEKRGKGSKRVHYIECTRADSNENILGHKSCGLKKVYTRNKMEAMRFVGVEEQKKAWAEVYYCGLTPDVMREYNGLVATSFGKHIHVNYIPKHSIFVKRRTEPSQEVAVN